MSKASPSVAVLVSAGRHPITGSPRACRGDAIALAIGRKIAGDDVRVLHYGSPEDDALKDYLALGASAIEVIPAQEGVDAVSALAPAVSSMDLILTGSRSEQGAGSGLLPYLLATALARPVVADVLDAKLDNSIAVIRQFLPKGRRRRIEARLPVILSLHALAPADLAYAFARRQAGRIGTRTENTPSAAHQTCEAWTLGPASRLRVRLKAAESSSGHERLMTAIGMDNRTGVVVNDGTSVDKAQVVLTYLRNNRLIDF